MTITFECEGCRKKMKAPDAAAGKKGKCPFCGRMNAVPRPVAEDEDIIPLAPIDEEDERRRREEIRALYEQEQDLLAETGGPEPVPLEHRDDLESEDLHHFVVNYCLDMANGKLDRAQSHAEQLRQYGMVGLKAVEDFIEGLAMEPALDQIPRPVLQGFLRELKSRVF